jgi:uncharacterized metal-binding protein YceD (DUF177 family)
MSTSIPHRLRIADLASRKPTAFSLMPDAAARAALAKDLGIVEIRKLRLDGEIAPQGGRDWALQATLGATVVQDCVITLEPVVTRLDEDVRRTYVQAFEEPDAAEIEMPEDETVEPIPAVLDLQALMAEALSLALPAFPRAAGVELGDAVYTEDGVSPMTDEDAKPFAGLGALKAQLEKKSD